MSENITNEPTITETTGNPDTAKSAGSTDVFEEWNFQNEIPAETPAVFDGKIIARMPDLGSAPRIANVLTETNELTAWELFCKAVTVALKRKRKTARTKASNKDALFGWVSAAGAAVVLCGIGILFLSEDKAEKTESSVPPVTAENVPTDNYAPAPVSPATKNVAAFVVQPSGGNQNINPVNTPPAEEPYDAFTAEINTQNNAAASNPWERTPNNPFQEPAATVAARTVPGSETPMYPIQSPVNTPQPAIPSGFSNTDRTPAAANYTTNPNTPRVNTYYPPEVVSREQINAPVNASQIGGTHNRLENAGAASSNNGGQTYNGQNGYGNPLQNYPQTSYRQNYPNTTYQTVPATPQQQPAGYVASPYHQQGTYTSSSNQWNGGQAAVNQQGYPVHSGSRPATDTPIPSGTSTLPQTDAGQLQNMPPYYQPQNYTTRQPQDFNQPYRKVY